MNAWLVVTKVVNTFIIQTIERMKYRPPTKDGICLPGEGKDEKAHT